MKTTPKSKLWRGVICAVVAGWLAHSALSWVSLSLVGVADSISAKSRDWSVVFIALLWLTSLPLLGWVLGMICTFFWQGAGPIEAQKRWGLWTLLAALSIAGCSLVCAYPLAVWPFARAIEWGAAWWPTRRYRQFFGLSNDWEREQDEPNPP